MPPLLLPDPPAGKAAAKDEHALDDDTLQCAICFDLCVRPITVSRPALPRAAASRLPSRPNPHTSTPHPPTPSPSTPTAGPLPAQLLPQVLPGPGEQGQEEGLPQLPSRVWR
jgi:hypothetical protein